MLIALTLLLTAGMPNTGTDTATTCGANISRRLLALERVQPRARASGTLEVIANACSLLPAELRSTAKQAARAKRPERLRLLGEAAQRLARPECRPSPTQERATALAERCPLPKPLLPSESLLSDLDQGSYAFGVTLLDALQKLGVRRDARTPLFDSLALATALEAHALAKERR